MSKQRLSIEQKQQHRLALEQQRMLGQMLEKNDAELTELIDNKVAENQALEKESLPDPTQDNEPDDDMVINDQTSDKKDDNEKGEGGDTDGNKDQTIDDNEAETNPESGIEPEGLDYDIFGDDDDGEGWSRYNPNNRSRDDEYIEPIVVAEKTMQEDLMDQLGELKLDEIQEIIAKAIIGNLSDNGYLRRSTSEIADDVAFKDGYYMVSTKDVEKVLDIVQTMDPPGIAARDLKECILLQLKRKPDSEDVRFAIKMVEECLEELSDKDFAAIARRVKGLTPERALHIFKTQILHGVNPNPGSIYGTRGDRSIQMIPDFDVEYDGDKGVLTVTLRNNIPALQISESYVQMNERYKSGKPLSKKEQEGKKAVVDAYQRASTFIEVLKQRQETLFNTMSAIVKCQHDYFISGDERDLKPLGQQQIAEMIGKDVSVVSRAVNNKYVQLPWGKVKSLKSFFSEDINGASRHEVYDDLKKLVAAEDKKHPLSDDALCTRLKEMGYQLERRTVAKYRDTLGIPSSTERRRKAR